MAATVVIAIVLSAAALAWVVWPLLNRAPAPMLVEDDRLADLLGRKDAVLAAIRDLEFDYRVGKLSEEDYQLYDARLRRQAVGLLQQVEQIAPASTGLDATVEHEILRRRKVVERADEGAPTAPTMVTAPVVASRPALVVRAAGAGNGTPPAAGARRFCTQCGAALEPHHRFCATCGTPVDVAAALPAAAPE